ncbi:glycoside hydrolase superfamily [Echria macrotheca]|uniref:Glycoside hydrolase superfamily n=1 Tax=Echria macrotheca TaxID=438768 RepID=A0AAJ0BCI4_9PEZI|nr:glycoside hydrolase superfamily [Echria macrotheca]
MLGLFVLTFAVIAVRAARSAKRQRQSDGGWPYGPFHTSGRDIVNSKGDKITWAGVNWPLSGETMIPEGLEHAFVDDILNMVASVGFNFVRMRVLPLPPYAIQMIDEIYSHGGVDVTLEQAMISALGTDNGTKLAAAVVSKNPIWTASTPRFKIWSDIARLAARKGIYIHPDAHVSKAQACCSHTDGDAWFKDVNFNTTNWKRGLMYVANWARNHTNIVSMSLRNAPRESWSVGGLEYNWQTFVGNMTTAAEAVHQTNPDLLITWGGLQFGEDLSALTSGKNLLTAPCYHCTAIRDARRRDPVYFALANQTWANKVVWELHLFAGSEDIDTGSCRMIEAALYRNGFNALGIPAPAGCNITTDCPSPRRLTPVILSEFGHVQDATLNTDIVQNCIKEYTKRYGVSWSMWSLAGSYRVKSGVQGVSDPWGLTDANWTGWRYPEGIETHWRPWVASMGTSNATKAS